MTDAVENGRRTWKRVAEGIYRLTRPNGESAGFYERVRLEGRQTYRRLPAGKLEEAKKLRALRRVQYEQWKFAVPGAVNPYAHTGGSTLPRVVEAYLKAGAPLRRRRARSEATQGAVKSALTIVASWPGWGGVNMARMTVADLERYEAWRRANSKIKNGRTLDLEITYLRAAFRWARARGMVAFNPFTDIDLPSFRTGEVVRCRECRPEDAEELHLLARSLFTHSRATEALGWQLLFEAFFGLRTGEALMLRFDSLPGKPGCIEGDYLHVGRLKRGVNPWVHIHDAGRQLLQAHRRWHKFSTPWFFPGIDARRHVDKCALSHALARITKRLNVERRTSHGLRAYYVTVRRSQGIPDAQIAAEIGDKSGAEIIVSTYGDIPPNWREVNAGKLGWLPKNSAPAWEVFNNVAL